MPTGGADDLVEIRMQQRFSASEGNRRGLQSSEMIDAGEQILQRNGRREIVILIAIAAGQVATTCYHDLSQERIVARPDSPGQEPRPRNEAFEPVESGSIAHRCHKVT